MARPVESAVHERLRDLRYTVRRKFWTFLHHKFHVYDSSGRLVAFGRQKGLKLKEDIRLYADESMAQELLWIQARGIIDFGMTYDVTDSATREKVGAIRRKGLQSMFRDEWHILDREDRPIGLIQEDSMGMALLRRFLTNLVPQKFEARMGDRVVARYEQRFNPVILKLEADFGPDAANALDRRLGIAAALLLSAIERRQN